MDYKKFSLVICLRVLFVTANALALVLFAMFKGYHAATLLAAALLVLQVFLLITFVSKTNDELVRFLGAARYADYAQKFELSSLGSGFDDVAQTFSDILNKFHQARAVQEEELRHLKALIEHVPVPLLSIDHHGGLTLWNNAAHRLFGNNHVTKLQDLKPFGKAFAQQMSDINVGKKPPLVFQVDGVARRLSVSASQITLAHKQEMLISLHDIQSELDAAQLDAWQDLVKVLTHEIMNSITPVASLANTSVDLISDLKQKAELPAELAEDLHDISDAVETVARRSDSLIQFVSNYRRLTKLPTPNKKITRLATLFQHCTSLATQNWPGKGIHIRTLIEPEKLEVNADKDMLEQVLLNLLLNAEHAVEGQASAEVKLSACLNKRGHVIIEVKDNGTGISEEVGSKIFVPFYTTKKCGSGVGLALSRQIVLAHGASIQFESKEGLGAVFTITFF